MGFAGDEAARERTKAARRILRCIAGRSDGVRVSEEELSSLGPEATDVLLEIARSLPFTRRRVVQRAGLILCALATGYCLFYVIAWLALGAALPSGALTGGFVGGGIGSAAAVLATTFAARPRTASLIARFGDERAIGALAQALPFTRGESRRVVAARILEMLPRLDRPAFLQFSAEHRAAVYGLLRSDDEALALAVLAALSRVGGAEALPYVIRLANDHATAIPQPVREAAGALAADLQETADRERVSRNLLRATEAPSATLVRPVAATQSDADQLLRAGEAPSDGG